MGGATQSILDGYTNIQILNTWEHFKYTIREHKSTKLNVVIYAKPLMVPCLVRAGKHDFRAMNNTQQTVIMALRRAADAMNAKLRMHLDNMIYKSRNDPVKKPLIHQADQMFDLNDKTTKWDNSVIFEPNNAFTQCTREMQRTLDQHARQINYRRFEHWALENYTINRCPSNSCTS